MSGVYRSTFRNTSLIIQSKCNSRKNHLTLSNILSKIIYQQYDLLVDKRFWDYRDRIYVLSDNRELDRFFCLWFWKELINNFDSVVDRVVNLLVISRSHIAKSERIWYVPKVNFNFRLNRFERLKPRARYLPLWSWNEVFRECWSGATRLNSSHRVSRIKINLSIPQNNPPLTREKN